MRRGAEAVGIPLPCLLRTIEPEVMSVLWVRHQGLHGYLLGVKSVSIQRRWTWAEGCGSRRKVSKTGHCLLPVKMRGMRKCQTTAEEKLLVSTLQISSLQLSGLQNRPVIVL